MQFTLNPNIPPNSNRNNTYSPNFTGSVEEYCRTLDKVLKRRNKKLSDQERKFLTDEFINLKDDITSDEKLLGKGYRGRVYQLNNKYAIKILNRFWTMGKPPEANFEIGKHFFQSLQTYMGEAVATIGDTVKFLKNVGNHTPAGVPESLHLHFARDIKEIQNYYLNKYLPKFAKLPQESFDAIAMDCSRLNKIEINNEHFKIDVENPNNVVLSGKKLLLIDDLDLTPHKIPNTAGTLLDLFLFKATHQVDSPAPGKRINEYRTLFKKVMIAAEKANLNYIDSIIDLMAFNHVITNCKPKSTTKEVYDELRLLRTTYTNIDERLEKLNEIFTREFSG